MEEKKESDSGPPNENEIAANDPWLVELEKIFWIRNGKLISRDMYLFIAVCLIIVAVILIDPYLGSLGSQNPLLPINKNIRNSIFLSIVLICGLMTCLYTSIIWIKDIKNYTIFRKMGIIVTILTEEVLEQRHRSDLKKKYYSIFFVRLDQFKNHIHNLINKSSPLYALKRYSAIKMNKDLDLCFAIFTELLQTELLTYINMPIEDNENIWLKEYKKFYREIVEIIYHPESQVFTTRMDVFPLNFQINGYLALLNRKCPGVHNKIKEEIDFYYSGITESENRLVQLKMDIIKDGLIALLSASIGILFGLIFSNRISS